jgi:diguanylate cyclase (GGDEF)-like protein
MWPNDDAGWDRPHAEDPAPTGPEPSRFYEVPRPAAAGDEDPGLYDEETGLPSRLLYWDRVEQALAWGDRHGGRVAVLLLDVGDVGRVRDKMGPEAGIHLVRQVGRRLVGSLRKQDSVARTSEYEFAVLLPEIDSVTGAATVAHKLLRLFERHFDVLGTSFGVTPSIGAAVFPDHAFTLEALLGGAGVAKNAARAQGRGVFLVFAPGMSNQPAGFEPPAAADPR